MQSLDIRKHNQPFGGLYGYLGLRFVGFAFIALSQLAIMYIIVETSILIDTGDYTALYTVDFEAIDNLMKLGNVGKPIIMCTLFAIIFVRGKNLIKTIIFFFVTAVLFYVGEVIVLSRVLLPFLKALFMVYELPYEYFDIIYPMLLSYASSFANLNVFLDMFLCTLIYAFLWYTPKSVPQNKMVFYRLLAIIPYAYIICSFLFSTLYKFNVISYDPIFIDALFCKGSLPSFIIFTSLILFLKYRERIYYKNHKNDIPFEMYIKTSSYSFSYSVFLAIVLAVISVIEFLLNLIPETKLLPFGGNYYLFFAIPFVLLFNVNKITKFKIAKAIVPTWMFFHYFLFVSSIGVFLMSVLETVSEIYKSGGFI